MKKIKIVAIVMLSLAITGLTLGLNLINARANTNPVQDNSSKVALEAKSSKDTISVENNVLNTGETQTAVVTQDDIQNKIANSIDYFTSAEGSYRWYQKRFNYDSVIDYKVKLKDNPGSYEKETLKDGSVNEAVLNGKIKTIFSDKTKKYKEGEAPSVGKNEKEKSNVKDRYFTSPDGSKGVYLRTDPAFMLFATESLFNQNLALGVLEDHSKWSIIGTEKFLDLEAVVIEGKFSDYYSTKFQAVNFKIWVEKNTGIILRKDYFNKNGEVVEKLETTYIKINGTIDDSAFKKDKTGYTPAQKPTK